MSSDIIYTSGLKIEVTHGTENDDEAYPYGYHIHTFNEDNNAYELTHGFSSATPLSVDFMSAEPLDSMKAFCSWTYDSGEYYKVLFYSEIYEMEFEGNSVKSVTRTWKEGHLCEVYKRTKTYSFHYINESDNDVKEEYLELFDKYEARYIDGECQYGNFEAHPDLAEQIYSGEITSDFVRTFKEKMERIVYDKFEDAYRPGGWLMMFRMMKDLENCASLER